MPQILSADSSRTTEKIVRGLSLKAGQNPTIYMNHFVGGGGIQNHQPGCHGRVPPPAPIKSGVRQVAEQLLLLRRQQRAGSQ